jgi:hypothetical protein
VGCEEVDAMAVAVASGSVVVLGGSWVGVPGKDLGVSEGDAGIERVGDGGVPQGCGLMWCGIQATFAIRVTIR